MKTNRVLIIIFLVVAIIGFADATYLTVEHYLGAIPPCAAFLDGCENVLTSKWSQVEGFPISLIGAIYYLLIAIFTITAIRNDRKSLAISAALLTPLGFIASAYLVYLQFYVINNICVYCLVSAVTSTVLFILGASIAFNNKNDYECDSVFHPCIRAKNNFIVKI